MEYFFITLFLIIISSVLKERIVTKIKHLKILKEIPEKKLAEQTETRVCSDCGYKKNLEEFKGENDPTVSYRGLFVNCIYCRIKRSRKSTKHHSYPKNDVVISNKSKSQKTNNRKKKKEDKERIENFKKFGKELTNKEILDRFEKQNIPLDFDTKTRIENQLNGLVRILELPYEMDVIRKKQFKYLNDIGVWYDINGRRIVKFPKSEKFWKDAGGRDATRGVDDWASK